MKNAELKRGFQIESHPKHEILYISPRPFEGSSLFYRVNRAGVVLRTPADFYIRRNETYCFGVVHCVLAGHGSVTFRGKTHLLRAGQMFLLPPYERHEYASDPSDPMGLCFVEFFGGHTPQMTQHVLEHAQPVFEGVAFADAMTYITQILSRVEYDDWLNVNLDLYAMLTTLCKEMRDEHMPTDAQGILKYVNAHYTQELPLRELAHRFGYNAAYFSRKFRQISGLPLSQYVMGRRISQACYLLITTAKPLEEIAEELGFYDLSHMIARFRQIEGVTPAQYRKQNHGLGG